MTMLHLADGFDLPLEAVTETFAILAKRGSGKTSTAVVLAEEMIGTGQQVLTVDPTGVWWGLRAGRSGGQDGGLPVVIVGGDHADLSLVETEGAALAKMLVAEGVSAVLDLSQLSKSATRRVMTDFLETLYRVNRDPLHLIVDEADLLAPQRLPKDMLRLLGAMDDVVRRGRAHGLGVTLISQRHVDCTPERGRRDPTCHRPGSSSGTRPVSYASAIRGSRWSFTSDPSGRTMCRATEQGVRDDRRPVQDSVSAGPHRGGGRGHRRRGGTKPSVARGDPLRHRSQPDGPQLLHRRRGLRGSPGVGPPERAGRGRQALGPDQRGRDRRRLRVDRLGNGLAPRRGRYPPLQPRSPAGIASLLRVTIGFGSSVSTATRTDTCCRTGNCVRCRRQRLRRFGPRPSGSSVVQRVAGCPAGDGCRLHAAVGGRQEVATRSALLGRPAGQGPGWCFRRGPLPPCSGRGCRCRW